MAGQTYRVGTKRTKPTWAAPHAFETQLVPYRKRGGGYAVRHEAQRDPTLKGILSAMEQITTPEFSIRVLGKLVATPVNYPVDQYPPHEYLYLGQVRNTKNALDDARARLAAARAQPLTGVRTRKGSEHLAMLDWVSNWSNFQWEDVATLFLADH